MEMIIRSLKKCGITISTVMDCSKDSRVNIEGIEYVTLQSEEEFHLDASSDGEDVDHDHLANNDLSLELFIYLFIYSLFIVDLQLMK